MTERDLAEYILADRGQVYVDEEGGTTLGGIELSEKHKAFCFKEGKSMMTTNVESDALRHWAMAAGYGNDNKFTYILANSIQNA